MAKYQVETLSGVFVYDAEDDEQAARLGGDGGRIVTKVTELDDDEPDAQSDDGGDESAYGDEEVIVIRRSDYDRLTEYAERGGLDTPVPAEVADPSQPVDVSDVDASGTVAPDATLIGGASEPDEEDAPLTGDALHERARELDIEGRSSMTADELRDAIADAEND